jgi:hypothetical protein
VTRRDEATPATSTPRVQRHRARKAAIPDGDDMATLTVPRRLATEYLARKGIQVSNDRELAAALEPVLSFVLKYVRV